MKPGIKIGLRDYQEKIPQLICKVCEVYFRHDKLNQYDKLLVMLKNKGIQAGLHFWGFVKNKLLYNLAYPDNEIRKESIDKIKQTIDLASQYNLHYVNIHPGGYRLAKVDLDQETFTDMGQEVSEADGEKALFDNLTILDQYAKSKNVLLLTETVPSRVNPHWYNEQSRINNPLSVKEVRVKTMIKLSHKGFFITNDFTHTLADEISDDRDYLFDKLYQKTKALASQTKLIHVNTSKPPFNGTDTHNGILDEDFQQNVLPSKEQLIKLLTLFKKRNDVWLVPEPMRKHLENTKVLQKLVRKIEKE